MAATETLSHPESVRNPRGHSQPTATISKIVPRYGVVTLSGYGINVRVDRGHLILEDGIADERRKARLPRVGHELQRLIVIGSDGQVTLSALRWLADQNAAFVMLERDGKVSCVTGPVRPSDARLRRAQALAVESGAALLIAKELIGRKLVGQETVLREKLREQNSANVIADFRQRLTYVTEMADVRAIERQAALIYWGAWRGLPVTFPKSDQFRTPEHWRTFGTRQSELTGSQRLATTPINAMLNYLYAILESESRLALAALGLDPGLAFIHVDTPARDSLACDLMEVVRPKVDSYVLDWILRNTIKREWFFEMPDGNCRLMESLARHLSETARMWRHAVAPTAEWIARTLWTRRTTQQLPATRLTQQRKREVWGAPSFPKADRGTKPELLCRDCGKPLKNSRSHKCNDCYVTDASTQMLDVARLGRETSLSASAQAKRSETQSRQNTARWAWKPEYQPTWLTEKFYVEKIHPAVASTSTSLIAKTLGVTRCYALRIKQGKLPHPRHWKELVRIIGVYPDK